MCFYIGALSAPSAAFSPSASEHSARPNSLHLGTFLITSKSLHPGSSVVHPSHLVGVLTSEGLLYYHDTFYLSVYVATLR